jgi:hypothetical protein
MMTGSPLVRSKIFAVFKSRWINSESTIEIYPITIFLNKSIAYEGQSLPKLF